MPRKNKPGRYGVNCLTCGSDNVRKDGEIRGTQRWHCSACGTRTTAIAKNERTGIDPKTVKAHAKIVKATKRYVITAAQNATPVFMPFFKALVNYCYINKATLIVIPYRYKNPTSIWSEKAKDDDWWAAEVVPYLIDTRLKLNGNLLLMADIKTQPTANSPLQGFESMSGAMSAIIGHPKLELTTVATPQHKTPKILTTTGAITEKNYLPSKAGKKGEFHHTFGACVVELDGDMFHMRQLNAVKDGSFMDLRREYFAEGCRVTDGVAALVMGDSHIEFMDKQVDKATFGKGGIVDTLRPKYVVWHDLWDGFARNHHHEGEAFINYVKHHAGTDDVEKALDQVFDFVDTSTRPWVTNVFVPSNHPDVLAKWVKRADWKSDPRNAKFLLRTALVMLEGSTAGESGASTIDPFVYWAKQKLRKADQTRFLARDESFQVHGIELSYHGDRGANGSRGSRRGFSRIGTKVVIGHSHSPGITEGAYQTGLNCIVRLGYNSGPSSWLHTDCIVYENGKRSLLNIVDGKWRGVK